MADPTTITVMLLGVLAKELVLPLSKLAQQALRQAAHELAGRSQELKADEIKKMMQQLAEQNLVKATPTDNDIIYTITADGVKELDRTTKGFFTKLPV